MSSKPSKKEAERNAKQLESLLEVPENRVCADCGDSKPKWASANIGVFLCIRCAGLHRNLGREISVIKSVALDSWTASEVETMTRSETAEPTRCTWPQDLHQSRQSAISQSFT
ncbi:Arf GTPase activating protein [Rhizoclosmatium globosum]|uniref:Arf GTPase activating protein n=1 Tax=Rhizoclosmatium globosum TaxID=329046 RepID=A0A1Y2ABN2_9FUNG|nr:Arf GTPase activating protein [Rhizoclosmatium globosum]|eukprot:ORY19911.1 Arf GTPase activating protein [Rhizoclosmatium globosum]